MPVAALHCAIDPGRLVLVQICKNAVLVFETTVGPVSHGECRESRVPSEGPPTERFAEHSSMHHSINYYQD